MPEASAACTAESWTCATEDCVPVLAPEDAGAADENTLAGISRTDAASAAACCGVCGVGTGRAEFIGLAASAANVGGSSVSSIQTSAAAAAGCAKEPDGNPLADLSTRACGSLLSDASERCPPSHSAIWFS